MADQSKFRSISINIETYEKLVRQAERNYRTVPAQVRYLADAEEARPENAAEAFAILEGATE